MEKGSVIRVSIVRRGGFGPEHYGVYDGNGGVYHFVGENIYNVYVRYSTIEEFENEGTAFIDSSYERAFSPEEIIRRAQSKLGSSLGGYDLYSNNCEHFASWCVTGVRRSRQTGHYNREDDTRDLGEKLIDDTMEPYIKAGDKIDKYLGWGDYRKEDEKKTSEVIFDTFLVKPLEKLNSWFK